MDNEQQNKTHIIDLVLKCRKEAIKEPEQSNIKKTLSRLVLKLKEIFESEYCAIGTIDEKYAIDRACTRNLPKDVNRASIDSPFILVCKALRYQYNDAERQLVNYYTIDDLRTSGNYEKYKEKLNLDPQNTTVIIIQDKEGDPQGYIQLINSKREINANDYEPYKDIMLQLAFVLKQWYALEDEGQFLKDFKFINDLSGETKEVSRLLSKIIEYLSKKFNAGIISYRIPLFVRTAEDPVFYLHTPYANKLKIPNGEEIENRYLKERLIIKKERMGGVGEFRCKLHEKPVIVAEPVDLTSELGVPKEVAFKGKVIIIPIIKDHSDESKCDHPDGECCKECKKRFESYYGVFKLRILKNDEEDDSIPEEVIDRLHILARHISMLFNAMVDKEENESLKKFQNRLNNNSFTDQTNAKDFDSQSAETIMDATGAVACAIYKYDKLSDEIVLSAASQSDQLKNNEETVLPSFGQTIRKTISNCRKRGFEIEDDIIKEIFNNKKPVYYVTKDKTLGNSMMIVPMLKKDQTQVGLILLIGKNARGRSLSKTYWEQDKKYIQFMADILSRIEESDSERLVFLMKLSHELRKPITQMVYKNDFFLSAAKRNRDNLTKKELLDALEYNTNQCMLYKQVIQDIESTYYLRKNDISCYPKEENVKDCLLDVIRLFEQGGGDITKKGLTIETRLSQMPQTMYVDKERIKQVFVNILRNAIQYSDKYTVITISYNFNLEEDSHEIDFSNYGIGVEEKDKNDIFKLWKRSEAAQERRPNGNGMGLAIVKEIMEKHEGDCYVKRLNNPTVFTVKIPQKH